jgi:hypothetical protein
MNQDLTSIAREVVRDFFAKNTPLNELITARAQESKLNEHMIRRLCEMANTETRLQFYRQPGINQAAALFEPADAAKIIVIKEPEMPTETDYMLPPTPHADVVIVKQGSSESLLTKAASAKQERRSKFEIEEKRASVTLRYSDFVDARNAFLQETKNYFRESDSRLGRDINKMASYVDGQETLKAIFPHMKDYMQKLGMQKQAMEMEELMNEKLPVTYVIGTNPVVLKYKECIMQGEKLRNSIVELERAEGIVEKKANAAVVAQRGVPLLTSLGQRLKALWAGAPGIAGKEGGTFALKNNKLVYGLGAGIPLGAAVLGSHMSGKQQEAGARQMEEQMATASSFDNPDPHAQRKDETQLDREIRDKGFGVAMRNESDRQMQLQRLAYRNQDSGAAPAKSVGISDQFRTENKVKS